MSEEKLQRRVKILRGAYMPHKKRKGNPAFMKELKCSSELREFLKGEKRISFPQLMKRFWDYAKKHKLQLEDNKRVVRIEGTKLEPLFSSKLLKKHEVKMRGKKIKVPAGHVFMTEIGGALNEHVER
jgi:chromatin remodeling complex protein RSC6